MDPPKESSLPLLWLCLLGAVIGVFSVHAGRVWDFTADDATVGFAYARNVADGVGYVLAPGAERVEAPESLLWVLLLSLARPLHVAHEPFAKALGLVFGAGALAAAALFPAAADGRRPRAFDLVAPAVAASFAHFALGAVAGLAVGLCAFLAALAVTTLAWEERDPTRAPWSSLALAGLCAARPDGAVALVTLVAVKAARAAREAPRRQDILWALGAVVGVGALALFRGAYFAAALPNGFRGGEGGGASALGWLRSHHLGALAAVAPIALLSTRARTARTALAATALAGLAVPLYRGGAAATEWRDLAAVTPLACLLVAEGLRVIVRALLGVVPPAHRRLAAVALSALAAWGFLREGTRGYAARFAALRGHAPPAVAPARARARCYRAASRALGLREVSVLDPAIGVLTYEFGLRAIDPRGVGDAAIDRARHGDPRRLLEVALGERPPALVSITAAGLPPAPALDRLFLPLSARAGECSTGDAVAVRRELLAAPWNELADPLADAQVGGPDGVTVASAAVSPDEPLSVSLGLVTPTPADGAVVATASDGRESAVRVQLAGGWIEARSFERGERPWVTARLRLPAGSYRLVWRSPAATVALGEVRVASGAGLAASRDADDRVAAALARDRVGEARRVALRLLARLDDVPDDPFARGGTTRLARSLAARAARLGDGGAFAVAADLARESRRFAARDPEADASLHRLIEAMADASRRAERDGRAAEAFALARDAVLLDPRRSWLRRRAEAWRQAAPREGLAREVAAYEAACAALAGESIERAVAALGAAGRWREVVTITARAGRWPEAPVARARGHLGRGEFAEARAIAAAVPCAVTADPELARALRAAGWTGACPSPRP